MTSRIAITLGADSVDVTDLPALTNADKKALKAAPYSVNMRDVQAFSEEDEANFSLYFLRKLRPATTLEEVDAMPARVLRDLVVFIIRRSAEVDSPFSGPSTSSPGTTDGRSMTSPGAATLK